MDVVLVVDVANVMGSRPDGWWRDRAGAAARLVGSLAPVVGRRLALGVPTHGARVDVDALDDADGARVDEARVDEARVDVARVDVARVVAVLEGKARGAVLPDDVRAAVDVRLAAADGDSCVVEMAAEVLAAGGRPVVVTADRGLRDRLPAGTDVVGPRRLLDALDGCGASDGPASRGS